MFPLRGAIAYRRINGPFELSEVGLGKVVTLGLVAQWGHDISMCLIDNAISRSLLDSAC